MRSARRRGWPRASARRCARCSTCALASFPRPWRSASPGRTPRRLTPCSSARRGPRIWRRSRTNRSGDVTMDATELTWADQIDLRSSLRTQRKDIRRLVQLKFGRVSPEINALVEATETEEGLTALFDRAVVAQNEDELLRPLDDAQP